MFVNTRSKVALFLVGTPTICFNLKRCATCLIFSRLKSPEMMMVLSDFSFGLGVSNKLQMPFFIIFLQKIPKNA